MPERAHDGRVVVRRRSSTTVDSPTTASSDRTLCQLRGRLLGGDGLPLRHVAVRIATPEGGRCRRARSTSATCGWR
ncbi:MAG: hypothetical protein ACK5BN_18295 [Planctomycetota bacterium]